MNDEQQNNVRTIRINGQTHELQVERLDRLLLALGYESGKPGIAVAVNGAVVPRSQWAAQRLKAGDDVEIVGAVQGG